MAVHFTKVVHLRQHPVSAVELRLQLPVRRRVPVGQHLTQCTTTQSLVQTDTQLRLAKLQGCA